MFEIEKIVRKCSGTNRGFSGFAKLPPYDANQSVQREVMRIFNVRLLIYLTVALVASFFLSGASAQNIPSARYSIPSGPAGETLPALARTAEVSILFDFEVVSSIETNSLHGVFAFEEALENMLRGTSLTGDISEDGVVKISVEEKSKEGNETVAKENSNSNTKRDRTGILAGASLGVLSIFLPQGAQAQDAEPAEERTLDTVTVSGIRGGLESAAAYKQNSDSVVDAISSVDIGKFPDTNVAESLQRITGVAITRARGGEGRFVTVRGLGEEFNSVKFNGRTLATENLGREFSFDVLASEVVSRAEVRKTSTADLDFGSIGGMVNIVSSKPLDSSGFNAAGSIGAEYDELAESTGFRASGVISNTFNNDTVGILGSLVYHGRDIRSDTYESIDFRDLQLVSKDVDGDGSIGGLSIFDASRDTADEIVTRARQSTYSVGTNSEERERLGATLAFQYSPSTDLDITADLLYTNYKSPGESNFTTLYFGGLRPESIAVDPNQPILSEYTADFTSDYVARSFESDTDTLQIGLNADWQFSDNLNLVADVSWSKADGVRDNIGSGAGGGNFLVLGIPGAVGTFTELGRVDQLVVQVPNFDPAGMNIPDINGNPVAGGPGTGLVPIEQADPRLLAAHFNRISQFQVEDEVFAADLSGTFEVNEDVSISSGLSYTDRTKSNNLFANSDATTNGQCEFCSYTVNFQSLNPGAFDGFATPLGVNILPGAGVTVPQGFLSFSASDFRAFFENVNVGDFNAANAASSSAGLPILQAVQDLPASNTVEESIFSAFLQANIDGVISNIPYSANFGVRVENTSVNSIGFQAQPTSVIIASDGLNQSFPLSQPIPVSISGEYTNFLPAANIKFELTDELFLRAGYSETLSRPTLTDLSTKFSIGSTNLGVEQIDTGNPGLEAPVSSNIDFSLEYYGNGNGITASAAFFNKDIEGFVANRLSETTLFLTEVNPQNVPAGVTPGQRTVFTSRPENAEEATVTGVELAVQKLFDNGFGVIGNVTFVETEAQFEGQDEGIGLENVSPLSYNLSAFYENDLLSARLSYNFREGYLQTTAGLQNHPEFVDDYSQLDFSSSFNINDNFSVFFDAINITEEESYTYSEFTNLIRNYEENGRRFLIGGRATF